MRTAKKTDPATILRAPRGGAVSTVNGRFYGGGQFMPLAPCPALASGFDLTRHDGMVTIADPTTGDVESFLVAPATWGALAGRRIVSRLVGDDPADRAAWLGFGFVDDFGLTAWSRFAGKPEIAGYVALLTESHRFAGRLDYRVSRPI